MRSSRRARRPLTPASPWSWALRGASPRRRCAAFSAATTAARLVTLGPSILRTETAGIVAPALVLYELGGMGNRPSPTYEGNRG